MQMCPPASRTTMSIHCVRPLQLYCSAPRERNTATWRRRWLRMNVQVSSFHFTVETIQCQIYRPQCQVHLCPPWRHCLREANCADITSSSQQYTLTCCSRTLFVPSGCISLRPQPFLTLDKWLSPWSLNFAGRLYLTVRRFVVWYGLLDEYHTTYGLGRSSARSMCPPATNPLPPAWRKALHFGVYVRACGRMETMYSRRCPNDPISTFQRHVQVPI